ncbi:MAG TPA: hypothetical protein DD381_10815 [Lentisphaeria bacterium]|nr:MAG: hypothetical protein A2X47_00780 [Lentisphaerae bacterium GWF2_38_69]HBM16818.1 hypothetical protein [Lentisphaeria bacterium]
MTKHAIKKYDIKDSRNHLRGSIIISKNDIHDTYTASIMLDVEDKGELYFSDALFTDNTEKKVLKQATQWIKTKIPITEITSFNF